jgi:hypothetical protein
MPFDKTTGDAVLIVGDRQSIVLHRRTVNELPVYDLKVWDKQDMIAFVGMDKHQLHNVAIRILDLLRGP